MYVCTYMINDEFVITYDLSVSGAPQVVQPVLKDVRKEAT